MIIVLMGVAGSGKTTVGRLLSADLGWPFFDGDNFHPLANVEKMRRGIPLTDADRISWLDALNRLIGDVTGEGRNAVIACSALKQAYRERLKARAADVRFVHLRGDASLMQRRLEARPDHFMKAGMLASQFDALEEPADALIVDAAEVPKAIVARIRRAFGLHLPPSSYPDTAPEAGQ
ncbi:MAG TPA: gluconokinase [Anaerolineae bacterium]|nr:gluconokinase [Anaerolineae bacterium]